MAQAYPIIKEIEEEVIIIKKVPKKTGVTLELTPQEANVLFCVMGKANGFEANAICRALRKHCTEYDYKQTFHGQPDINIHTNKYIQEYINQPLKD